VSRNLVISFILVSATCAVLHCFSAQVDNNTYGSHIQKKCISEVHSGLLAEEENGSEEYHVKKIYCGNDFALTPLSVPSTDVIKYAYHSPLSQAQKERFLLYRQLLI